MNAETTTSIFLPALAVAFLAALIAAAGFWRRSLRLEAELADQRRISQLERDNAVKRAESEERERGREALRLAEERHEVALQQEKASALSVVVHPFVNTDAQKGIFSRETNVQIGYKYQLFVQGLPCFEPHVMVLESSVHKEVDEKMLELLKNKAEQAAEAAVMVKSGGVAKAAITIAKTAIKLVK